MGYSCCAKSMRTLKAIQSIAGNETNNGLKSGGFWDIGKENQDGSITGSVYRHLNKEERERWEHLDNLDGRVTKRGSFRIEPDGKVKRFPGVSVAICRKAEKLAIENPYKY